MANNAARISREHKVLISQYATAAINLYGIISVSEFVEVFNRYEETHTTDDEVLLALTRLARTDDVEYSICDGIISGPEFQPDFDDYKDNVEAILEAQRDKPRYLPDKEEFLKYVDDNYFAPEKQYIKLKAFILKHNLCPRGDGLEGVDGDLLDLREMIQFGVEPSDELGLFSTAGYQYKDLDEANAFFQLVMDAHNHTRMYDNNGFTPFELAEQSNFLRPNPLRKEPFGLKSTPKGGRN